MNDDKLRSSVVVRIIELTDQGQSRKSIARELNISHMSVYRYQKKFDLI